MALLALGLLLPGAAGAAETASAIPPLNAASHQTGTPAQADWKTTLQSAEQRLDLNIVTQADLERTQAEQARAAGFLSGAPILGGLYRSDRPMTNIGATEMQLDVRLPLRRFGQTEAWHELAKQAALNGETRAQANRLALMGSLRQMAWDWQRAETELNAAQERERIMQRDLTAVTRQVKHGEAAEVDKLSVESRALAVHDAVVAATVRRDSAKTRWQQMTGTNSLPSDLGQASAATTALLNNPAMNTPDGLLAQQPLLRQMASEVGLNTARIEAEHAAGEGAPEVGFGVKRDRGDRGIPYDNSLLLTFSLPIGGHKYHAPALAEMAQQRASTQVALIRTTQQLLGEVRTLRQRIAAWPSRLSQLDQRAALSEKTLTLKQKALRLGELDWSRLLDFEREAADARLQARVAHIDYQADQSNLKQALGILPDAPSTPLTAAQ